MYFYPIRLVELYLKQKAVMENSNQTQIEIEKLESQVDVLIRLVQQLKEENSSLRSQQTTLQHERSKLIEKNEAAKTRVEAMISRLKALESNA